LVEIRAREWRESEEYNLAVLSPLSSQIVEIWEDKALSPAVVIPNKSPSGFEITDMYWPNRILPSVISWFAKASTETENKAVPQKISSES
jgi:hypothetical protein